MTIHLLASLINRGQYPGERNENAVIAATAMTLGMSFEELCRALVKAGAKLTPKNRKR